MHEAVTRLPLHSRVNEASPPQQPRTRTQRTRTTELGRAANIPALSTKSKLKLLKGFSAFDYSDTFGRSYSGVDANNLKP